MASGGIENLRQCDILQLMREHLRGVDAGVLPEEGGQRLIRGARNHDEKHYACVREGEPVNFWWRGGGALTEGQTYTVYPCDPLGEPYSLHPEGNFVHVHQTGRRPTVEELHNKVKNLGYSTPSVCILCDPETDDQGRRGYLVKVGEVPKPAWETETWGSDHGRESGYGPDEQEAGGAFLWFLGGGGARSV